MDFEEDIYLLADFHLPNTLATNEYLKQGLLVISTTLEWNLLCFKSQNIKEASRPIISSLYCGQLKDDFKLTTKKSVYNYSSRELK